MANELTTQPKTIKEYLDNDVVKNRIKSLLQNRASTFIVSLLASVNTNPSLAECEPSSIFNAAMKAVGLNLPIDPGLGYAYLVPYRDKNAGGIKKAQFQIGAKGYIQIAQRCGLLKTVNVTDVREGERGDIDRMTGEAPFTWVKDEVERNKLPIIGHLAFIRLNNGFEKSLYMSTEEIRKHGNKYSQSFKLKTGQWIDDFDSMARKTVLKLLIARWAPTNIELQTALQIDQAVIEDDGNYKYVDNQTETAQDIARDKERVRIENHIESAKTIEELEMVKDFLVGDDLNNRYYMKQEELKEKKKGNE
jgi:recombination protein RecT